MTEHDDTRAIVGQLRRLAVGGVADMLLRGEPRDRLNELLRAVEDADELTDEHRDTARAWRDRLMQADEAVGELVPDRPRPTTTRTRRDPANPTGRIPVDS